MLKPCPNCKSVQASDARYCNYCAHDFADKNYTVLTKEQNAATNHLIFKVSGVALVVVLLFTGMSALITGNKNTPAPPAASLSTTLPPDAQYLPASSEPVADEILEGKVVGVADGDTVTVLDRTNKEHKIRFAGIDAPESKQDFGNKAKENLSSLVFGKTVRVITNKTDKYGRTVGVVMLDDKDINLEQIKAGFAWHYKEYQSEQSEADRLNYSEAENTAKKSKLGLWSMANPTAPWAFRNGADVKPEDADKIFGNKNSLIYHWAGCPGFTKISAKNRVVFATPTEAEAAGYQAAKNCTKPFPLPSPSPETEIDSLEATTETEDRYTETTPIIVPVPVYTPTPTVIVRQPMPAPEVYIPGPPAPTAPIKEREETQASSTATAICKDGTLSYSANRRGTCSHHGGVSEWLDTSSTRSEPTRTPSPSYPSTDTEYRPKTVQVDGYYRKDGTYVRPHTRSAPRRKN